MTASTTTHLHLKPTICEALIRGSSKGMVFPATPTPTVDELSAISARLERNVTTRGNPEWQLGKDMTPPSFPSADEPIPLLYSLKSIIRPTGIQNFWFHSFMYMCLSGRGPEFLVPILSVNLPTLRSQQCSHVPRLSNQDVPRMRRMALLAPASTSWAFQVATISNKTGRMDAVGFLPKLDAPV
ncbi:hypothetical protein B0T17DRAFT_510934 [Bombardia bombarda]|uniref:Uncharacterized protein n=1 Tax=Bombardia bombarda TaxID=252184 RepID=A0AA39WGV1_9PEZI|nr:hypothetical protein B0T17DRAFT_510934 [Bombardia bombarda]